MANHIESLFIDDLLLNYLDDFCNNAGVSRSVFLKNFYTTVAKTGELPFEPAATSHFATRFSGCPLTEDDFSSDNDRGDWSSQLES
ncbi:hypothetical protein LFLT20_07670 [Limosilactobacillus fermentum]|nr:hypothetical protein LFLT20_07670 [Limosilactobacillus fermentum]